MVGRRRGAVSRSDDPDRAARRARNRRLQPLRIGLVIVGLGLAIVAATLGPAWLFAPALGAGLAALLF